MSFETTETRLVTTGTRPIIIERVFRSPSIAQQIMFLDYAISVKSC